MAPFLTTVALLLFAAPAVPVITESPERLASEKCVWNSVQRQLGEGAKADHIDAQLAIGRNATDDCAEQLRNFAEASPAVNESGEAVGDVEMRMRIHYVARGALFAEGKTEPYYLAKAEPKTGIGTGIVEDKPTDRLQSKPMANRDKFMAPAAESSERKLALVPIERRLAFRRCLAHLSNAPEYANISDRDLYNYPGFIEAATDHYCSDDFSDEYYDAVWQQVSRNIGLAAKENFSLKLAERDKVKREIVAKEWSYALRQRGNPQPLSEMQIDKMIFSWVLDKNTRAALTPVAQPAITCTAKLVGQNIIAREEEAEKSCGYTSATTKLADMVANRFSGVGRDRAYQVASGLMNSMLIFSAAATGSP